MTPPLLKSLFGLPLFVSLWCLREAADIAVNASEFVWRQADGGIRWLEKDGPLAKGEEE